MNKEKLKEIITRLKDITAELESEVYSDLEAYKTYGGKNISYNAVSYTHLTLPTKRIV